MRLNTGSHFSVNLAVTLKNKQTRNIILLANFISNKIPMNQNLNTEIPANSFGFRAIIYTVRSSPTVDFNKIEFFMWSGRSADNNQP